MPDGWRDQSIYIAGGTLLVDGSTRTLVSERDITIGSDATLNAKGTIQVGADHKGEVRVYGTLCLGDATGAPANLTIQGNLTLMGTSTTQIRVKDGLNDKIGVSRTIDIQTDARLVVVDMNNAPNQTWAIFQAGSEIGPNDPQIFILGNFSTVTNGFTTIKTPNDPTATELKLKKGNG